MITYDLNLTKDELEIMKELLGHQRNKQLGIIREYNFRLIPIVYQNYVLNRLDNILKKISKLEFESNLTGNQNL